MHGVVFKYSQRSTFTFHGPSNICYTVIFPYLLGQVYALHLLELGTNSATNKLPRNETQLNQRLEWIDSFIFFFFFRSR